MHKPIDDRSAGKHDLLSETNLARLISNEHDSRHTENLIKQESVQLFERESYSWFGFDHDEGATASLRFDKVTDDTISSITRLYYQPVPLSAMPMERFGLISPANEPTPVIAQVEMQQMRVGIGSLETTELRSYSARVATGILPEGALDRDEVFRGFRKARETQNIVAKTRVARSTKRRRRAVKGSEDERHKRLKRK